MAAIARKEEIQQFIEDQLDLGEDGLDENDHYLLEINSEVSQGSTLLIAPGQGGQERTCVEGGNQQQQQSQSTGEREGIIIFLDNKFPVLQFYRDHGL